MGLLGNILVTFALMLWPMVWIVSIMGMGGPGASNRLDWMIQLLVYMSYPIWMFGLLSLAGKSFWGLASGYFLIGCLVLFIIFNAGMFRSISNLLQGIRNEGYSVAKNTAYFNAKPIVEADAKSFDTFKGDLSYFFAYHAWDNEHTYYRGEVNMATSVLSHYDYYERPDHTERGYHRPKSANEMDYVVINSRRWCISICGYYNDRFLLIAELNEHLIVKIVFHVSSCWPADTLLPEGLKEHLLPFLLDYLSLTQIIPTEGVPESELPPLGFYPSKREEKEIDSEGNAVAEDIPASSSSEWGW